MNIFKRSIATLLIVCMTLALLPAQQVFAEGTNLIIGHGEREESIIYTYGVGNLTGGVAGQISVNQVILRVYLSREKKNFTTGRQGESDALKEQYASTYPKIDSDYALYFMHPNHFDHMNKYGLGTTRTLRIGEYIPATHGFSSYEDTKGQIIKTNDSQDSYDYEDAESNIPKNVFREKVLADPAVTQLSDIAATWVNYLPTYTEALGIVKYLFHPDDVNKSINGTLQVDVRLRQFATQYNKEGKNNLLDYDVIHLTPDQRLFMSAGQLGVLTAIYVMLANNPDSEEIANYYRSAIDDYINAKDIEENPVSLVIDTCVLMVLNMEPVLPEQYCILPCMDYIEYTSYTSSNLSIKADPDIFSQTLKEKYPSYVGSTRNFVVGMLEESRERFPDTYAKDRANVVQRFADEFGYYKDYETNPFYHAKEIPQFSNMYYAINKEGVTPVFENFYGFTDRLTLNGGAIKGFMLYLFPYIAPNEPDLSFKVMDNLTVTDLDCDDAATVKTPPTLNLNFKGDATLTAILGAREAQDENFKVDILKDKSSIYCTVLKNGISEASGGTVYEAKELRQDLLAEIPDSFSGWEMTEYFSGKRDITIKDEKQLNKSFSKTDSTQTFAFVYEVNLTIKIDDNEYSFKNEDIVVKGENNIPLNYAQCQVSRKLSSIPVPDDIEIPKPNGTMTTDIMQPSENEDLPNNTQLIQGYEYTTESITYAEIKDNEPLKENYEVLGGVPSTEELYFSVGGNEFQVSLVVQYWMNEHSRDRTYTMHFDSNVCEYNNQEKGKGDSWEGIDLPQAAGASQTTTRFEHATGTSVNYDGNPNSKKYGTISVTATWNGSIPNNASAVVVNGVGTAFAECPAEPDISQYVEAISQANEWMSAMAALNIEWTAASDKATRKVTVPSLTLDQSNGGSTDESGGASDSGNDGSLMTANASSSFSNPTTTTDSAEASHTESCGSNCTKTVPDPCTATANPSGPGSYSISITYTIAPHAVCGPCCEHVLPDVWDTWKQGLVFDYVKISQIRLYKLDQGLIENGSSSYDLKDLTGMDKIYANVVTGNPTYFMNIAEMTERQYAQKSNGLLWPTGQNPTQGMGQVLKGLTKGDLETKGIVTMGLSQYEQRRVSQSSRDGRLRYTLADGESSQTFTSAQQGNAGGSFSVTVDPNLIANPMQHDDVIYHLDKRSANCDGMGTTGNNGKSSSQNAIPMDKTGHVNEWADGILYTNIQNTTNYSSYHTSSSYGYSYQPKQQNDNDAAAIGGSYDNSGNFTPSSVQYYEDYNHHVQRDGLTDKTAYSDKADNKDILTAEWKAFDKGRRTKIKATVISDFLILQTSGGDQSIYYFEKTSEPTEAQEHFQKVIAHDDECLTNNPLSIFNAYRDCSGISNGSVKSQYSSAIDKNAWIVIGGYNGKYKDPENKYKPYSLVKDCYLPFLSDDGSGAETTYNAMDKSGTYQYWGGSFIKTTLNEDPAKTITRPKRQATSQDSSFKIYQKDIQIIPTTPNALYTFCTSPESAVKVWYPQVMAFYTQAHNVYIAGAGGPGQSGILYGNVQLGHPQIQTEADKIKYMKDWGTYHGTVRNAVYAMDKVEDNYVKINSVVVFTPTSTEDAIILPQGDIDIDGKSMSRDQRVDGFKFPNMNELADSLKVCPLDPALCEYRYLDCKYDQPTDLANFDFENAVQKDGKWVVTDSVRGIEYTLPTGFSIESAGRVGSGKYLVANGRRWSLPLGTLGLSNSKNNVVDIEMDLTVSNSANNLMLLGFKNYGFIITPNSKTGSFVRKGTDSNGATAITQQKIYNNINAWNKVHLKISMGFNNIVDCSVTVNGVPANIQAVTEVRQEWKEVTEKNNAGYNVTYRKLVDVNKTIADWTKDLPKNVVSGDLGSNLNIGGWESDNSYAANYYIDNLRVILAGGSHEHTSACYTSTVVHKTGQIHVHNDTCYAKTDIYTCDGALNANYQAGCNNLPLNTHIHNNSCYTTKNEALSQNTTYTVASGTTITWGSSGHTSAGHDWPKVSINGTLYNSSYSGSYTFTSNGTVSWYIQTPCSGGAWCNINGKEMTCSQAETNINTGTSYSVTAGTVITWGSTGHTSNHHDWPLVYFNGNLVSNSTSYSGSYTCSTAGTITWNIQTVCQGGAWCKMKKAPVNNAHIHTGTSGLDYANGCYTIPTEHKHNNTVKVLTCQIPESGGGTVYNYSYTGGIQSVNLPAGRYKLEVWGSSGSGNNAGGGYSTGEVTFTTPTTVYIGVGGTNGYNGGGSGNHGNGGGATHIGFSNAVLSGTSKSNVLIVAGGAGGGCSGTGGAGGGANMSGLTATNGGCGQPGGGATVSAGGTNSFSNVSTSYAGTRDYNGSYGQGGSGGRNSVGGGGGIYGGAASYEDYHRDDVDDAGGGGGSGYADTSKLKNISGQTGGHSGAGVAKITALSHSHTDACYTTTTSTCNKIPAGSLICNGEPNTTTDMNSHQHTVDCLKTLKILDPVTFQYSGSIHTYKVPYDDTYTFELYGPSNAGNTGYVKADVDLKAGTQLYLYVGAPGANGFNKGMTDVRLMSYIENSTDDKAVSDANKSLSDNTRILAVGSTPSNRIINKSMTGIPVKNEYSGTRGSTTNGWIRITPQNKLPNAQGGKTLVDKIVGGEISEKDAAKYLGEELANIIIGTPQVFKTWSNWSYYAPKGVMRNSWENLYSFSGGNIVSNIAKNTTEFTIPVNINSKTLRRVEMVIDNNTTATSAGLFANYDTNSGLYVPIKANTKNQTIVFDVSDKWWNINISSINFDPSAGLHPGTTVVKSIKLIGHATVNTDNDNTYNLSNLLTLNNFSAADTKGFVNGNNTTISYSGNKMVVKAIGPDPITRWNTVSTIQTGAVKYIKLVFANKSGKATVGQMFYGGTMGVESETNSFVWDVGATTATQTVWIDTVNHTAYNETMGIFRQYGSGWSGNITNVRFDWSGWLDNPNDTTEVSEITFIGKGTTSGTGSYNYVSTLTCGLNEGSNGYVKNFAYTGNVQSVTLPSGKYTLEVWGAQGGSANGANGGYGGYSVGTLSLSINTKLYIVVGGKGSGANGSGGYNGGGGTGGDGAADGGGATHIATANGVLSSLSGNKSSVLLVAGGGGGAGHSSQFSGGKGGGLVGGKDGSHSQNGTGGTQSSGGYTDSWSEHTGYTIDGGFGFGGSMSSSASFGSKAGGGSGWYGGGSGVAGGGGSGYVNTSKLSNASTQESTHTGDGYARITELNHTHTDSCYTETLTESKVTITAGGYSPSVFKASYRNPLQNATARQTIYDNYTKIPDYVDGSYNPIWLCKFVDKNAHICVNSNGEQLCLTYTKLDCTEPHHRGEHYGGTNKICYSACGNDANHKTTAEVTMDDGITVRRAEFLQLDLGFVVYFPNRGDFPGYNELGLLQPSLDRQKGYSDNMDTTNWTREKRVKFPFDVIYEGYIYRANTWIDLYVPQEYFNFYLLVSNPEMSNAQIEFEVEAINCATRKGNNVMPKVSYKNSLDKDLYKNAVQYFKDNYLVELAKGLNTGYKIQFAKKDNNSTTGTLAYSEYGIQHFIESKHNNLEEGQLNKNMRDTNTKMKQDFSGAGTCDSNVNTHAIETRTKYMGNEGNTVNATVKAKTSNDNKTYESNRKRDSNSYTSLHGGYKTYYLDVIGRIGNFTVVDTEDFRFSNFFKTPIATKGTAAYLDPTNWLVEGLVLKVYDDRQNLYIGDTYDIRGQRANADTLWLDTYGTESWMRGQMGADGKRDLNNPNLISQILTANVNNIDVLKTEELRFGYDAYTSIETIGSYEQGKVQVIPKYYALKLTDKSMTDIVDNVEIPDILKNANKGDFIPLDVYIDKDGLYSPVNIFGNARNGNPNVTNREDMYDYVFNLDWTTESGRRNYTLEEKATTLKVADTLKQITYLNKVYDDEGNLDISKMTIDEVKEIEIPKGRNNMLGTAQYTLMDGKHRTFIGSSSSYGEFNRKLVTAYPGEEPYFGISDTTIDGTLGKGAIKDGFYGKNDDENIVPETDYQRAVQRWHGKLGLPSSSVFVPHDIEVNSDNIKLIMNDEFAIICTAEIIAIGSVWSLHYSQPWFTRMTINGEVYSTSAHYPGHRTSSGNNNYECPDCLPPIIAIYASDNSSVGDVEIIGTH